MWWLHWLDPFTRECHILGCQEQILCRPPELGFERYTSGSYLLPCLVVEWAGLQVMFWCLVCFSTGALSLYADPLEMVIQSAVWVPGQGFRRVEQVICFSEGLFSPSPGSLQDLIFRWLLLDQSISRFPVADVLRPAHPKDSPKAGVDECLSLILCRCGGSPCFSSIKQDRFYSGVENTDLDDDEGRWCPYVLHLKESCSHPSDSALSHLCWPPPCLSIVLPWWVTLVPSSASPSSLTSVMLTAALYLKILLFPSAIRSRRAELSAILKVTGFQDSLKLCTLSIAEWY